jgi:hypothetical protein
MTRKRPYLKPVALKGRAVDEMASFDRDMLIDEALDQIVSDLRCQPDRSRDKALIEAWLTDISKSVWQ